MRTSPLLADFIHARGCKPICAKLLTLPKIDLYPYISGFKDIDRKTYGAPCQRCIQGRITAIFNLYHDIFSTLYVQLYVIGLLFFRLVFFSP